MCNTLAHTELPANTPLIVVKGRSFSVRAFTARADVESLLNDGHATGDDIRTSGHPAHGEQFQALKKRVWAVLDGKRRPIVSNSCPMEAHLEPQRWTSVKS